MTTKNPTVPAPMPPRPALVSPLVDAAQLATYLGISARSLRRLVAAGGCPKPVRLGGAIRWNLRVIEQWIRNGCPTCSRGRA